MNFERTPKFVRPYSEFGASGLEAVSAFCNDVREGNFPSMAESFGTAKKRQNKPKLVVEKKQAR